MTIRELPPTPLAGGPPGSAGASALAEAALQRSAAAAVGEQISLLTAAQEAHLARADRYEAGARGEGSVFATVAGQLSTEWRILADRRWPGTRRANIDVIAVGPGGVFVLDAKNWRDVRIENGSMFFGDADASDEVRKVLDQADAIAAGLVEQGLSPNEVHGVIVLAFRAMRPTLVDGVYIVGERSLSEYWASHGARLSTGEVERVAAVIDEHAPPAVGGPQLPSHVTVTRAAPRELDQAELATVDEILEASRRAAELGPIESWMVWLDPQQAPTVSRSWNGPARVRGAAGTGKTVVALHRAARMAKRTTGEILVTSYVKSLPKVHKNLLDLVAPDVNHRIVCQSLHGWSMGYLRRLGTRPRVDENRRRTLFRLAYSRTGAREKLAGTGASDDYWWDEVATVIKGRGLTTRDEYLQVTRTGRRVPLQPVHREAVWALYEEYERRRQAEGLHDWADVLLLTLKALEDDDATGFDGVVVDEVQDISAVGLRIVARLCRTQPGNLLLVGDGQQAVYPGGVSLREAGINITGRSVALTRNYRNAAAILRRAMEVVASDEFDDLGEGPERGARELDLDREGGIVDDLVLDTTEALSSSLLEAVRDHVRAGFDLGGCAVLCRSNEQARNWVQRLTAASVPAVSLESYDGRPSAAVKVGTYQRAKGLEFAFVAVPHHDLAIGPRRPQESDDAYAERCALERRQLFVAMTRARDRLWLGRVDRPSPAGA